MWTGINTIAADDADTDGSTYTITAHLKKVE